MEIQVFGPKRTKLILSENLASNYIDHIAAEEIRGPPIEGLDRGSTEAVDGLIEQEPPVEKIDKRSRIEAKTAARPAATAGPAFYVATEETPKEWGVIARRKGAHVALNLHEPKTMSLVCLGVERAMPRVSYLKQLRGSQVNCVRLRIHLLA